MKECMLYEPYKNNAVRCLACSQYCLIAPGKVGLCGVRQNISGKLKLLVYGYAAAVAIDPMEKKPLFHFLPGQKIFSFGTLGCNFGCDFCQNWDISQATKSLKQKYQDEQYALQLGQLTEYGQRLSPSYIVRYARTKKIPAVAFTYNEPTIFFEYAYDTMKLARDHGIKTVFVSNGYESKEAFDKLKGVLDAINIDLKSMNPNFYLKTCKARLEPVKESIQRACDMGFWLEVTTLLISGVNDSEEEIQEASDFLKSINPSLPWHLTAFHPDYKMLDYPATPHESLIRAYNIAKESGMKFVYIGNVSDPEKESTFCPKCQTLLIKREGYEVDVMNLVNGKCKSCNNKIPGIWQ